MDWPDQTGSNHNLRWTSYCTWENCPHLCFWSKHNIYLSLSRVKIQHLRPNQRQSQVHRILVSSLELVRWFIWATRSEDSQVFALFTDYPFGTELRAHRAGLSSQKARSVPPAPAQQHDHSWWPFADLPAANLSTSPWLLSLVHHYLEASLHQKNKPEQGKQVQDISLMLFVNHRKESTCNAGDVCSIPG